MECIICANLIDNESRICSAVVCNHNNICSICYVRIRALQKNYNCVICKRELEFVVCFTIDDKKGNGDGSVGSNSSQLTYTDFEVWDNKLVGHDSILDNNCQMFFPTKYYKSVIQKLWSYQCIICFKIYRDMRGLKSHVSADHHMQICGLCVDNKHAFPSEQRVYSTKEYELHLRSGDNDGSLGHPNCEFCRKRYYDSSALFIHLNKDHFGCHICERNNIKFKYFKDYKHLESHFRKDHFLCEESCCLEKKFVVFENKIDFELHNRQHHPSLLQQTTKRNTTLKLDFKLSRSATAKTDEVVLKEDGNHEGGGGEHQTRYEGGMGGRVCDGEWQVELQYATTDPREALRALANAASSDEYHPQQVNTPLAVTMEEFPSLLGDSSVAAASTGSITIGSKWMSVGGSGGGLPSSKQRSKKTDFPDLPKSSDMLKPALYSAPGIGGHQRTAAAAASTSSGKSYVSTIEKEYESMGSRNSSSSGGRKGGPDNTQNNQLKMFESISGSWGARVSVKPQKAPKSSSSSKAQENPHMSYQPAADGGSLDYFSESRHSAPMHSLKAVEQSPSSSIVNHSALAPPPSSTDDYPQLEPSHATAPSTLSNVKKMTNSKPIAKAGGWEDALLSVGISNKAANKKVVKNKLSVVKLAKSNSASAAPIDSSLDLTSAKLIGKLSNDLSEWEDAGNRKGTAANSSSALKPKVKTENLFTLGNMKLSSSVDLSSDASRRPVLGTSRSSVPPVAAAIEESMSKTTALKTYGSWVRIGGAGK